MYVGFVYVSVCVILYACMYVVYIYVWMYVGLGLG